MNTDDPYPMFLDRVILHLFSHVLGIRGQEKFQTDMHQNLFCLFYQDIALGLGSGSPMRS